MLQHSPFHLNSLHRDKSECDMVYKPNSLTGNGEPNESGKTQDIMKSKLLCYVKFPIHLELKLLEMVCHCVSCFTSIREQPSNLDITFSLKTSKSGEQYRAFLNI